MSDNIFGSIVSMKEDDNYKNNYNVEDEEDKELLLDNEARKRLRRS